MLLNRKFITNLYCYKGYFKLLCSFDIPFNMHKHSQIVILSKYYNTKISSHKNEVEKMNYLANELCRPYEILLNSLSHNWTIPPVPEQFCYCEGWTKYDKKNSFHKVSFPDEDVMIFDIEVIVKEGNWPSIAVCLGKNSWYSWVSNRLIKPDNVNGNIIYSDELIPLFDNKDRNGFRCVIGHFVSYDRARVANEYVNQSSNTRYVDTMSMHIAISGMTTSLRQRYKTSGNLKWKKVTSGNSLVDVYSLYLPNKKPPQNKDKRNIFVNGSSSDIINNFQDLMKYCANDVLMTAEVFQKIFPIFQNRFPHKSVLYGMLELNSLYLPTNNKWFQFLNQTNNDFDNFGSNYQKNILMKAANVGLAIGKDGNYKNDPWLWDLKWTKHLPIWYKDLIPKNSSGNANSCEPSLINSTMGIAVKLLRLRWDGLPLYYDKTYRWGIIKPCKTLKSDNDIIITMPENFPKREYFKDYDQPHDLETNTFIFKPMVHKDGFGKYVNRVLSIDIISNLPANRLTSDSNIGKEFLQSIGTCLFWKSNGNLIKNQMIVKLNRKATSNEMAIIPLVIPISNAYRKIDEKLWFNNFYLTNQIGGEYKSMIMAPHNYVFVGHTLHNILDWIIGICGDSIQGELGASLFGKEVLNAGLNNLLGFNSTLYSNLAKITKIERNIFRRLVLILIDGGDKEDIMHFLMKNASYSISDSKNYADEYFLKLKGEKIDKIWKNGILSDFFNVVCNVINSGDLKTPFLNSEFSKPLRISSSKELMQCFLKSSIADYINSLIVHTKALICEMKLNSRLSICNKNEIRFLCHESDMYKMAYALHRADSTTKIAFASLLSLRNVPSEFRFLDGVDIDECWRMNPMDDFGSESGRGIYHNYGIKPGFSLNFDDLAAELKI